MSRHIAPTAHHKPTAAVPRRALPALLAAFFLAVVLATSSMAQISAPPPAGAANYDIQLVPGAISVDEGDTLTVEFEVTGITCSDTWNLEWLVSPDVMGQSADMSDLGTTSPATASYSNSFTSVQIMLPTIQDALAEGDETFNIRFDPMATDFFCASEGVAYSPNQTDYAFNFLLVDDDIAGLTIDAIDTIVAETDGGSPNTLITIELSGPAQMTTSVDWATSDATATAPSDYLAAMGTATFNPGESQTTVAVPIVGDTVSEVTEKFFINLSNPMGATINDGAAEVEITDNDTLEVAALDASIVEGDAGFQNVDVTIQLSGPAPGTFSVDWNTADITAIDGSDYDGVGGTVFFAAGETQQIVQVPVFGDTDPESDEELAVELSNATAGTTITDDAIVTILDDDTFAGGDEFNIADAQIVEGDGPGTAQMMFSVTLDPGGASKRTKTGPPNTVEFTTIDQDATAGSDYAPLTGLLEFQPGDTQKVITVDVIGDALDENNEQFFVQLSNPSGSNTLGRDKATGTILDDDDPEQGGGTTTAVIRDASITEGDEGSSNLDFVIALTNAHDVTVSLTFDTVDQSATVADGDYQAVTRAVVFPPGTVRRTVSVPVNGDTRFEDDETFIGRLGNLSGDRASIARDQALATIVNDDEATVSALAIDDASITEGDSGGSDLSFEVTLSPAADVDVTVDFATADGTAEAGSDYVARQGTLTFAAGETTQQIVVRVAGDILDEDDETLSVELSNPEGAELSDAEAVGTIIDDDVPALPTVDIDNVQVLEGDEGLTMARFVVRVMQSTQNVVQVDYETRDGTALAADDDYRPTSGRLMFENGETTQTIDVQIVGDTRDELDEIFTMVLSAPEGADLGRAVGTCRIVNDDETGGGGGGGGGGGDGGGDTGVIRLVSGVTVTEGAGAATVIVERQGGTAGAARAVITTRNGSAQAGADYVAVNQTVQWAAGVGGPRSVDIRIIDDGLLEGQEAFGVGVAQVQGASLGTPAQVQVRILDEDTPLRLEAIGDQELMGIARSEIELQVRVSREDGRPVEGAEIQWRTEGRARVSGEDASRSDAEGIARQKILLDRMPGEAQVIARLAGTESSTAFVIQVKGDLMDSLGGTGDENQDGVADAIDDACSGEGGDIDGLCDFIFGLDDPNDRRDVLETVTPRGALARSRAALQAPKNQARNVTSRMNALRAGRAPRASLSQLAMSVQGDSLSLGPLQQAIADHRADKPEAQQKVAQQVARAAQAGEAAMQTDMDGQGVLAAPNTGRRALGGAASADDPDSGNGLDLYDSTESPWGFFMNGRVSFGDAPRRGREPGYEFQTDGLSAGIDYRKSDRLVFGAALGFLQSDTDVEAGRGEIELTSYTLSLYATYYRENFYLDGVVTYGDSEYDISRVIVLPSPFQGTQRLVARGTPDSDQIAVTLGAGYDFRIKQALTLSGFVRGNYVSADVDGYRETGAMAFDLGYDSQKVESLLSEVGVELTYPISLSWGVVQPLLRISALHEFEDDPELIRVRFANDPRARRFDIRSESLDSDFFNIAAGLTATLQRGWATYFQYDTDLEREDLDIYTLSGGFRLQF